MSSHELDRQINENDQLEEIEIGLLLDGVYRRYGYDFRSYAAASIRRRIWNFCVGEGLKTISALQEMLLHEPSAMDRFCLVAHGKRHLAFP